MDKMKKLKPLFIILLVVLVVISSIIFTMRKNNKKDDIDKVISKYENNLINKDSYLNNSSYINIVYENIDEEFVLFTFSVNEIEVEDVIILISNKEECMSYGIKDSINTDFVLNEYNRHEGRVQGAKLMFNKSNEYYIYLSFYVNNELVEEFINIE